MREIKFRAWNKDIKDFFYAPSDSWSIAFHESSVVVQMWCSDGLVDEIPTDQVDQFTDFKDVKGVDVYERDIVECNHGYKWLVDTNRGCYVAKSTDDDLDFFLLDDYDFRVVGNIHDNPELLGTQNDH